MGRNFNASNTYIDAGGVNDLVWPWVTGNGLCTITGWIRVRDTSAPGNRLVWGSGFTSAAQKGWLLYYVGGVSQQRLRLKIHPSTGSTAVATAGPANSFTNSGQWYHFAVRTQGFNNGLPVIFTVDGTDTNGTVTNSISGTGGSLPAANAYRIGIGAGLDAASCFDGDLAELAIYSRTLSNAEINAIRKFTPNEINEPQHYVRLLGRGSGEPDYKGGITTTLNNSPGWALHPNANAFRRQHSLFGG